MHDQFGLVMFLKYLAVARTVDMRNKGKNEEASQAALFK